VAAQLRQRLRLLIVLVVAPGLLAVVVAAVLVAGVVLHCHAVFAALPIAATSQCVHTAAVVATAVLLVQVTSAPTASHLSALVPWVLLVKASLGMLAHPPLVLLAFPLQVLLVTACSSPVVPMTSALQAGVLQNVSVVGLEDKEGAGAPEMPEAARR
jgi:hypothetical protein